MKLESDPEFTEFTEFIGVKRAAKLSAEGLTVNGAKYQPAAAEAPAPKAKAPAATKP